MREKSSIIAFIFLSMLTLTGLGYLFRLRFESGDIYPPYSTLRSDPLGSRVLYESLETLPGLLSVERSYKRLSDYKYSESTTLFLAGFESWGKYADSFQLGQHFLHETAKGNRVIMAFHATSSFPDWMTEKTGDEEDEDGDMEDEDNSSETSDELTDDESDEETDSVEPEDPFLSELNENEFPDRNLLIFSEMLIQGNYLEDAIIARKHLLHEDNTYLPDEIYWKSDAYFKDLQDGWLPVYTVDDQPVIIERSFGKGTVILLADSFLLSNEALRDYRETSLLLWLIGNNGKVLFDESHLGVQETRGVSSLLVKYKMQGALLGLLLTAVLFVWRNAGSLVPPIPDESIRDGKIKGQNTIDSLQHLLQSNLREKDLPIHALKLWKQTFLSGKKNHLGPALKKNLEKAEALIEDYVKIPDKHKNPLAVWKHLSTILTQKPGLRHPGKKDVSTTES